MKKIKVGGHLKTSKKTMYALVDEKDFDELNVFKWSISHGYAGRHLKTNNKRCFIYMHQHLMGKSPAGLEIDHIDRNRLNNQRKNLRFLTKQENLCNKGFYSNNTSGYKCIHWSKQHKKWKVVKKISGNSVFLGLFDNITKACERYKDFIIKHH